MGWGSIWNMLSPESEFSSTKSSQFGWWRVCLFACVFAERAGTVSCSLLTPQCWVGTGTPSISAELCAIWLFAPLEPVFPSNSGSLWLLSNFVRVSFLQPVGVASLSLSPQTPSTCLTCAQAQGGQGWDDPEGWGSCDSSHRSSTRF